MCLYSEVFDIVSPMGQQVERLWLTEASVMYVSASGGDKRERWECSSMNSSFCPLEGTVINKVKSLYLHSTFKNGVIPKCFPVKNKKRGIKIVKGGKTKTNKMNKSGKNERQNTIQNKY